MPETADLIKLKAQATAGGTAFVGDTQGDDGEATTRIEFVAVDLNGDGDESDEDEGFFRVYQSDDYEWVSGKIRPTTTCTRWRRGRCVRWRTDYDIRGTLNCGDYHDGVVRSGRLP